MRDGGRSARALVSWAPTRCVSVRACSNRRWRDSPAGASARKAVHATETALSNHRRDALTTTPSGAARIVGPAAGDERPITQPTRCWPHARLLHSCAAATAVLRGCSVGAVATKQIVHRSLSAAAAAPKRRGARHAVPPAARAGTCHQRARRQRRVGSSLRHLPRARLSPHRIRKSAKLRLTPVLLQSCQEAADGSRIFCAFAAAQAVVHVTVRCKRGFSWDQERGDPHRTPPPQPCQAQERPRARASEGRVRGASWARTRPLIRLSLVGASGCRPPPPPGLSRMQ